MEKWKSRLRIRYIGKISNTKMRTVKISDQADYALEAIKLVLVKKLRRRMTKGQIVQYALRTLAERIEATMEGDDNENR